MTTTRSWRPLAVALSVCSIIAAMMVAPSISSADLLGSILDRADIAEKKRDRGGSASKAGSKGSSANTSRKGQGGVPPEYTPPEHGTNPHGQGTGAVVDLTPEEGEPLASVPDGLDPSEDVVVGAARGEEREDGTYHGHIVLAALFGAELIGVDTEEGESASGPLDPIQSLLDALCDGSSDQICAEVLAMESQTDANGSANRFAVANADLLGPGGVSATAIETNGNISEIDGCQTTRGDSVVANAGVLGLLSADAIHSSSDSESCADGSSMQTNSSRVVTLNSAGLGIPAPGCADGTPDSEFTVLAPLAATVCNADDSNGDQSSEPYGVREGLTAWVLAFGGSSLVKATTAASESQAREPGGDRDGDGTPDDGDDCPGKAGPADAGGCPDDDRDGIPNNEDDCPQIPGPASSNGCPPGESEDDGGDRDGTPDTDGDGLADDVDECPQDAGPESNNGCPIGEIAGAGASSAAAGGGADGGFAGADADGLLANTGADLARLGLIGLILFALGMGGLAIADRRRTPAGGSL